MPQKNKIYKMVLSAMFLALALALPFLTAQIPEIGKALCPMHIPVILCGFFCGPVWGAAVGAVAPLLRSVLFGRPNILPDAVGMCFELAGYGFVSAVLYAWLPKKKIYVYVSLTGAMLAGRVLWGLVRAILLGIGGFSFSWKMFAAGALFNAVPGIVLQLILIPLLVMALKKNEDRQ